MNALPASLLADVPRGHITPVCAHWWKIESPHGTEMVRGICKRCGEERDFPAAEPPPARIGHMPGISVREAIHHVD